MSAYSVTAGFGTANMPLTSAGVVILSSYMSDASTPSPMDPGAWARVREILHKALELPPGQRAGYLDQACGGDAGLRAEVESLIAAADRSGFLDRPAVGTVTAAALSAPAGGLEPGQAIAHYQVVEKIGQGGMGAVYHAIDTNLGRSVALKVISHVYASWEDTRRFAREAKAASALNSPNIVTIYEFDRHEGQDFIAMEYVRGATLHTLIAEGKRPLATMLDYARQAAGAIAKAHEAGIVHRDLKPGNIMVTDDGVVKVLDFGLAKLESSSATDPDTTQTQALTKVGMSVGTPCYMSPEHAMGEPADSLSDIFSFGVILYEIACKRRPFEGKNSQATLYQIAHKEPPSPGEVNPAMPRALVALIEHCLKKDPKERPQSMTEIALALAELAQPPVVSKSPIARWLMPAAALCLVAIAAGLWISRREGAVPATPLRQLTYSLEAQKMRGGSPVGEAYAASIADTFEGGWKFRLHMRSPQQGFLYLINRGPDETGADRFWILYPSAPSAIALPARAEVLTGWYVFDPNPGTERLWMVWADRPIEAVEQSLRAAGNGRVKSADAAAAIQQLLAGVKAGRKAPDANGAIRVEWDGTGGIPGELLELNHH
jgi:serine/threonine protein kinase